MQSIFCVAPCCPRGSLVPYKNEEQIMCAVHFLCCSSLSQRQSCPIPKRGESVPPGPSFARNGCPDVAPYYTVSTEVHLLHCMVQSFYTLHSIALHDQYISLTRCPLVVASTFYSTVWQSALKSDGKIVQLSAGQFSTVQCSKVNCSAMH